MKYLLSTYLGQALRCVQNDSVFTLYSKLVLNFISFLTVFHSQQLCRRKHYYYSILAIKKIRQ